MRWDSLVPPALIDYVRLVRAALSHRDSRILSPYVSPRAKLGRNCSVARNVFVSQLVEIGEESYINSGSVVLSGSIGRYCSIGYHCQIGLPEHSLSDLSTSPRVYNNPKIKKEWKKHVEFPSPPQIGNDVWIGSLAVVLQGVTIGDGAVIAAGAVVTKNVPPYAIVAGVPATILRMRFPDEVIDHILSDPWWQKASSELGAYYLDFTERFGLENQGRDGAP